MYVYGGDKRLQGNPRQIAKAWFPKILEFYLKNIKKKLLKKYF